MRTTQKQVENKFRQFVKAIGGEMGHENGQYVLNHNPIYGGYNIARISNDVGAECHPFGSTNRGTSEMWYTLDFAINLIWETQQTESEAVR